MRAHDRATGALTHQGAVLAAEPVEGRLPPLLKWAGGKERELSIILPRVPEHARFFDPFVGGGAVYFALNPQQGFIGDASRELIDFYRRVAANDGRLHATLDALLAAWSALGALVDDLAPDLLAAYALTRASACPRPEGVVWERLIAGARDDILQATAGLGCPPGAPVELRLRRRLADKIARMRRLEVARGDLVSADTLANIEAALKGALYGHSRALYNARRALRLAPGARAALFFFVRENAYASMFRYNQRGEFNVPYGGLTYNRKDLARKVAHLRNARVRALLARTTIERDDFERFLDAHAPGPEDFLFLDPPYDSEFSTYAGRCFGRREHRRLARYLKEHCRTRFLLVIKRSPLVEELYAGSGFAIAAFDKTYPVSFQDRNDRNAEHLLIANYRVLTSRADA